MPIRGISHVTLIVRNLERTARLFVFALGATEVYSAETATFSIAPERYYRLGDAWIVTMQGMRPVQETYEHIAFSIPVAELTATEERLRAAGLRFVTGRARIPGEGTSLYFYDFDNHLFELHTGTLERRLAAYAQHER